MHMGEERDAASLGACSCFVLCDIIQGAEEGHTLPSPAFGAIFLGLSFSWSPLSFCAGFRFLFCGTATDDGPAFDDCKSPEEMYCFFLLRRGSRCERAPSSLSSSQNDHALLHVAVGKEVVICLH